MTNQTHSAREATIVGEKSSIEMEGLQRRLSQRQLTMMAIGGAIGVGLFLGSSFTIRLAGPGVILSYLLGAVIALIMSYVLAEMAVVHPVAGAFGVYAENYLNPWAGFAVRSTYGLAQILAIGAEITAAGIYLGYWFPNVPQWIWVVLVAAVFVGINAMQVKHLGEFEYWFAMIKVTAIVAFILVGLGLIFGIGSGKALGLGNLTRHGGFLPGGWKGVWFSLTITVTSYMSIEGIAVTAGEARNPEVAIPKAMKNIVYRLILFYVLAIAIMVTMVPWNQASSSSTISGSPFVTAFAAAHIPYAAAIMNFVVLTAALSSLNTNLYLSTRMLFSLARGRLRGLSRQFCWLTSVRRTLSFCFTAPPLRECCLCGWWFLPRTCGSARQSRLKGLRACPCVCGHTRYLPWQPLRSCWGSHLPLFFCRT